MLALGLGLVMVIEGLALALAPARLDQVLAILSAMTQETRRHLGLAMVVAGAGLLTLWRFLAGA